jgi:hypothetical protein
MIEILFIVLKRKKYLVIALLTTATVAAVSYYLTVINVFHKSLAIYAWMNGLLFTVVSISLSAALSILFGVYIALLFFKKDLGKIKAKGSKTAGSLGAVAGVVASGCPTCGVPLFGFVGLPFGLFALPFKGLELKLLSIGLVGLSVYLVLKSVKKNLICSY